jgi:predicted TPR repeat methyltransferase
MSNYWMGWTYFLKNNIAKSLEYLEKSDNIDAINLKQFLYKYNEYTLIPNNIWSIYRDIISPKYNSKFLDKSINLPNQFVKLISKNIINLPKHYKILEIGSNIGMIGEYLPKYFLDSYDVEAIESSKIMCESLTLDSSLNVIYNKLSNIDLNNFLNSNKNKYDVIISFSSLCFTSNIETYICEIYKIINDNQYFAICLPIHDDDSVNINISTNEFNFNEGYLLDILTTNYFNIIISKKITLENNQKYCMIIARKAKF